MNFHFSKMVGITANIRYVYMKKLTNKQRAKIYREAAEYFSTDNWEESMLGFTKPHGFCEFIEPKPIDDFEEVILMKEDTGYWLDLRDHTNEKYRHPSHEQRIMCLLLAEQIALNP